MTYKEAADTLRKLPLGVFTDRARTAIGMGIAAIEQKEQRVLCKDCEHFVEYTTKGISKGYGYCRHWGDGYNSDEVELYDYCSHGERREK